jgi:enolase
MSLTVSSLHAWEILDSRGRPTLEVEAILSNGTAGSAQVPSGASTGTHEALELRDRDQRRYGGKGTRIAASNVNEIIAPALRGAPAEEQSAIDGLLIELDGTADKSSLGANAILGVSCAVARTVSNARQEPLFRTLGAGKPVLPVPMINILSGGLHAGSLIEFQDFLVIPHGFSSFADALEAAVGIHAAARTRLENEGYRLTGVADEGGWGPALRSNQEALRILTRAIEDAGYHPGDQVSIAIDAAASHFEKEGRYHLRNEQRTLTSVEMIELLAGWVNEFPVVSMEDGLAEDDWTGWSLMTRLLGRMQLVGDDLFTTDRRRLERGIEQRCANTVLVKMNQIGTLTETFDVCRLAQAHGYAAVISARSGETEDSFLADLAVATGAGQIKIGSITRSERLAKYNRLLGLEARHGLEWQGARFKQEILGRTTTAG